MDYITVIITAFVSMVVLFLLTKLIGNKQLSELTMFDYIVSITIGSIAAEMATELENPERPLIAMIVYALVSFGISILVSKNIKLRRLLFGHSVVLMHGGKLYRKNFKKSRLDLNEFLMQARLCGYFDLSAIDTAIMEASGKISFMPYAAKRPATPEDTALVLLKSRASCWTSRFPPPAGSTTPATAHSLTSTQAHRKKSDTHGR